MLEKSYRELHDGLGTVAIGLNLPKNRLDRLQKNADLQENSVDSIVNDAINQYLVFTEMKARNKVSTFELAQKVEELEKENRILKSTIDTLPKRKRTPRKKLRKHESSHLQMYLLLRTSEGKFINWTQPGEQQLSTKQKFSGLTDLDLKVMNYDLKKANLDENKNFLEKVQRELARREAMGEKVTP